MNYLPADAPNLVADLTRRKEFYQYNAPVRNYADEAKSKTIDGWTQKYSIADSKEDDVHLELSSYQSSAAMFLNPVTPYSRLLLKNAAGSGKTLSSINIAMQFIRLFERESQMEDPSIGSVFIIGFTEEIFKKDLLSFPRFGFVSRDELLQLNALKEAAHQDNKTDQDRLQEFMTRLKKRLGSRKENGYFRFFGYKAFVNRIFMLQDSKLNINDMSEEQIRQSLKDGSLKWNRPLLDSFRNSLVICDEIHSVYNSLEKNNWGVALQMVLDHDQTTKAVFMSATPINNNPTEVIDLINFFQPPMNKLKKEDFFEGKELKRGALDAIAAVFRGKVSFIQDTDPRQFATQTIVGDEISGIPYLRFTRCPMSKFHYATYKKVYTGVLAQDAQYLMDIAFPNPQDETTGLYRTTEIKRALSFATDEWYKRYGFKMQNDVIIGDGLDESRIGEWSSKMAALLKDIKSDLTPTGGKILVYHDVVHVSGVLFIEQLLQHNGFIGIDQNPTASTLCSVCGDLTAAHQKAGGGGSAEQPWRVDAADRETHAAIRQLHHRVTGGAFPGEITACNTRVMRVGPEVIAFLRWDQEDANVTRIQDVIVSPDYAQQGCEEYLLEHYAPDTVLTTVVAETNTELIKWWTGHHFREHDRADGNVYLNFTGAGMPEGVSAVALQPRWEADFARLRHPSPARPGDQVTVIVQSSRAIGYVIRDHNGVREHSCPPGVDPEMVIRAVSGGAKSRSKPLDHEFMPARYIMAHSDMDKSIMHKNIDRFNSRDNTWGYQCRAIIGSKIIKESYNFRAIRKVKVTARPANIATLIQIFGRSRRKKAHLDLPPEYRTIECKIFTSCLPVKDAKGNWQLSHEETKYREKMADYQIIQRIEQRIHEGAIDAVTARNIVLPSLDRKNPGLGALWFEPEAPVRKKYTLKDLNLGTFEIFHSGEEIRMQIYIIKRLFIETSTCFTFDQLWTAVRNPPFPVEQDCTLLQEDYFVIALTMLVFGTERDGTVRPVARQSEITSKTYMLDILHSDIDKRIMQADRTLGYIHHIKQLYIFIPFRNGVHDTFSESTFRTFDLQSRRPINVMRYLRDSSAVLNYENQKLKFKSKYENVPLEKLATVVGKFGVAFHQTFVEEIIKYVFTLWTSPQFTVKSELHEFYFKMMYYYDLMGLIVWAATAKEFIREMYKPWMLPVSASKVDDTGEIHTLEMSLNRSHPAASLQVSKTEYTAALKQSLDLLAKRRGEKKKADIVRADPKVLAIGHFMSQVPRFYHPDKDWFESPEYVQRTQEYRENDILIGYYEKSGTGLRVKFKIRTPMQLIEKHKDVRMIEKGSICSSNSKEYLIDMARRLKIKIPERINVPLLCQEIEERLQINELDERRKKTNVKWFYAAWEAHEGKRVDASQSSSPPVGGARDREITFEDDSFQN